MLEPVHHIEYAYERGKGWLPVVVREASIRQAVKPANFSTASFYRYQLAAQDFLNTQNRLWFFEPDDLP